MNSLVLEAPATETGSEPLLADGLVERVLTSLGFLNRDEPSVAFLRTLYAAWCRSVPFDNVLKLIHIRAGNPGPLPGSTAEEFLESWLRFGTGGTCWSGANAFYSLLRSLGFRAFRGVGTMLVAPELPPNHGTVVVRFDEATYLVDCSILHGEPLKLSNDEETSVSHRAWGVRCAQRDGRYHIHWRPLNRLDGFECRVERSGATLREFQEFYANTRAWSPFNYELIIRKNSGDDVIGIALGHSLVLKGDGSIEQKPLNTQERRRILIEKFAIDESIVQQLPADVPTPPPPWSRTAQQG